jgi:hypothetical protein
MHLSSHFSEVKIRVRLKFEVLFFNLRKSQKHHFPRRTSDLVKGTVNFTDSEMYFFVKTFDSHKINS